MKKDINIPEAKDVHIAIVEKTPEMWSVLLINKNTEAIDNVMVVSNGYGTNNEEEIKTSTLRHALGSVQAGESIQVENFDPSLTHLTHEYWLTYYLNGKIYDKKFIFQPGSLTKENLSYIEGIEFKGIKK